MTMCENCERESACLEGTLIDSVTSEKSEIVVELCAMCKIVKISLRGLKL